MLVFQINLAAFLNIHWLLKFTKNNASINTLLYFGLTHFLSISFRNTCLDYTV